MKKTIIESPFAATDAYTVLQHQNYLALCVKDSLAKGEAPFASHGFYTQYLDDNNFEDRLTGILAGLTWAKDAELIAVYCDMGVSDTTVQAIAFFKRLGIPIERRVVDDMEAVLRIKDLK